ncbi:UNVERIFIED_CONTAM: hypothetical protein FKN15_074330 [Acipenser sinensis]
MSASAVFILDVKGKVFTEYFKELEEESIQDNFVVVYELLDELMDFGFPQTTDSQILQEYITQQGNKLEVTKLRVPNTVTNAVSWRSEGIKYKKNEVFIDVIESVNLLIWSATPPSPVIGAGRGDKGKSVVMEDVKFHQCVRLSRFENDRTISFIPPDGDSELMSYRINTHVKPLIWIESVIEKFSHSRVEIMVKAKGQFKKQSVANSVQISVPVPSDVDSPRFKTSVGSAKYVPEKNVVIWTIKSFPVMMFGNCSVARELLKHGASANVQDGLGISPAHDAARTGFVDTLRVLVEYGASVNTADSFGALPVHIAVSEGHIEVVRFLAPRSDLRQTDKRGESALDRARASNHSGIVEILQRQLESDQNSSQQ